MTRYLAVELAPKGINVNAVSGGYVETGALETFPNKEKMVSAGKATLAGRMITAEDIAKVTAFLCTKDADMIRGQIIVVDGGITLQANYPTFSRLIVIIYSASISVTVTDIVPQFRIVPNFA